MHTHTCTYKHTCTYWYACMPMLICTQMNIHHRCAHSYMHMHTLRHMHTCRHTELHTETYLHTYTHTYTNLHTDACTHMQTQTHTSSAPAFLWQHFGHSCQTQLWMLTVGAATQQTVGTCTQMSGSRIINAVHCPITPSSLWMRLAGIITWTSHVLQHFQIRFY